MADESLDSVGRISRKFEIWQPHTLIHDLIRSGICWRFESFGAAVRYVIVLIHAVAAHPQSAGQSTVSKQTRAPGEEYDSTLVRIGRTTLKSLRAGTRQIHGIQVEKWPRIRAVNSRRIERLRAKTDRPVRDRSAHRHAVQIRGRSNGAIEVDHVPCFGSRHVNAEHRGILHPTQADDRSI